MTAHLHAVPATLPAYSMRHFEVVAPKVTNAGDASGYPAEFARQLDAAGFGWTAVDSIGSWHGKQERGTTFTIFATDDISATLASLARASMPDQEAIQVVEYPPVTLWEA